MTPDLTPLFERYRGMLKNWDNALQDYPNVDKCDKEHLINLCETAIKGIKDGSLAYGKLCRWLGFIQAIVCINGLTTVDKERDFTRPIFKGNE